MAKREITIEAPRTAAEWKLPEGSPDAALLWARSNRLVNELRAAESREQAGAAAVRYLVNTANVSGPAQGIAAVAFLHSITTQAFTQQAVKLAAAVLKAGGAK